MKLGFFDSGMGGIFMMQACIKKLGDNDYIYVGDTENLPYGPKASKDILNYMTPYLLWLLEEKKCDHVILACNTASAQALDKFLKIYPQYKGVIINIVTITQKYLIEKIPDSKNILVLGTQRTIQSNAYGYIFKHSVKQLAMPGLVNLIELDDREGARNVLEDALSYYTDIDYILLACTHYVYVENDLAEYYPGVHVIGQDSILTEYITKHLREDSHLKKDNYIQEYYVSGNPELYIRQFKIPFQKISIKKS